MYMVKAVGLRPLAVDLLEIATTMAGAPVRKDKHTVSLCECPTASAILSKTITHQSLAVVKQESGRGVDSLERRGSSPGQFKT